ncbi:MAG: DUF1566 domain-containing protein [Myxococcaceae bacterium]|nr:DUF1566 domain-containing protein [Myxococcaceae bacterium]MBH2006730.1 DUF1566 domain-containing protein [Myxococcaceae bacterium]
MAISDWRVPTVHEVQSLLDYVNAPAINENYFTSLSSNESVLVISSSSLQPTDQVLVVQPQTRSISSHYPGDMNVRCVRGPQRTAPLERYTKFRYADEKFVKDQATGIGWMTQSSNSYAFCNSAAYLSQVWTPTIKAVFSLFNQSNPPLIDEAMLQVKTVFFRQHKILDWLFLRKIPHFDQFKLRENKPPLDPKKGDYQPE